MATPDISGVETAFEAVIEQHMKAYEAALREVLGRKLTAGSSRSSRKAPGPGASASAKRRSREELATLGRRFVEAVEKTPGEKMMVLSASLGLHSQELEVPVSRLKKAGQVRTVGERSRTRYYPVNRPVA